MQLLSILRPLAFRLIQLAVRSQESKDHFLSLPLCLFASFPLLLLSILLLSCHPVKSQISFGIQGEILKKPLAKIQFDSSVYHFGELIQGQVLKKEIWFTNTGATDLQIELITACECTTLDWSRLPIAPGARSKISISYNSKDKDGPQIVDVEVIANTEPASTYSKFKLNVRK